MQPTPGEKAKKGTPGEMKRVRASTVNARGTVSERTGIHVRLETVGDRERPGRLCVVGIDASNQGKKAIGGGNGLFVWGTREGEGASHCTGRGGGEGGKKAATDVQLGPQQSRGGRVKPARAREAAKKARHVKYRRQKLWGKRGKKEGPSTGQKTPLQKRFKMGRGGIGSVGQGVKGREGGSATKKKRKN